MNVDLTIEPRKLLNLAPRWVRVTLLASAVVGQCMKVLHMMLKPSLEPALEGVMDLKGVGDIQWTLLGLLLTFPAVWLWRTVTRAHARDRTAAEIAEEYIQTMKRAMDEAELSPEDRKLHWRAVFTRLAEGFRIEAALPPPAELVRAIKVENEGD